MRGFFMAVLGLAVLDVLVSSQSAAANSSLVLTIPAAIARHVISPFEPAIPDLRKRTANAAGASNPYAQAQANFQAISATNQAPNAPAPSSGGNVGIEA